MHIECYFCDSTTHPQVLQIRASEEITTEQKRATWEDEQGQETACSQYFSLTRMQNQPWEEEDDSTTRKETKNRRRSEAVKDRKSSDLRVCRRRRNSVSPSLLRAGQKESSGRAGGSSGRSGTARMGWIAAEPENPKNSAIHRKEFPGAEGGDLNKRHS